MERMGEYVIELAKMLGQRDNVHFAAIEPGSVRLRYRVEHEATPKIEQRVEEINRNEAPPEAVEAVKKINVMLRDDNGVAYLYRARADTKTIPANEDIHTAEIFRFPGKEIPRPVKIGPLSKLSSMEGELVRIGGKEPHATIETPEGQSRVQKMTKAMAQELASHLYQFLRVNGDAKWERNEGGTWELKSFNLKTFTVLGKESLIESIERIRKIEEVEWDELDDPIGFVRKMRDEDDELH
jgi:hypothetical protein